MNRILQDKIGCKINTYTDYNKQYFKNSGIFQGVVQEGNMEDGITACAVILLDDGSIQCWTLEMCKFEMKGETK